MTPRTATRQLEPPGFLGLKYGHRWPLFRARTFVVFGHSIATKIDCRARPFPTSKGLLECEGGTAVAPYNTNAPYWSECGPFVRTDHML